MTSVLANVRGGLTSLERKLREARVRCAPGSEQTAGELGRLKSAMAGVESRCRNQKGAAASLVANSRTGDKYDLVAKIATAEERAKDFITEVEYLRSALQEVEAALWAAEQAAKDTAAEI